MEIDERHTAEQTRTIRALVQRSHRGPEDVVLTTDRRRPAAGPGDDLIRVGAAGVDFADVMQARGTYGGGPQTPYAAGFEAAGPEAGTPSAPGGSGGPAVLGLAPLPGRVRRMRSRADEAILGRRGRRYRRGTRRLARCDLVTELSWRRRWR